MSLGQIIRKQRESMGITLDQVSRKVGYSKPYISTIETDRVKNPPADELLAKLEKLLNFDAGMLVRIAHMQKLPADIREAFENSQAENEHWRALVHKLMQSDRALAKQLKSDKFADLLNSSVDNTQAVTTAGKLVPVINRVTAGYPLDYDDMGYPPGGADDYVRCPDLHDPNAFAVRVIGDSMEPKYKEGDIVVFSPALKVNNGDDCFIRLTDPHETTFKRVFFEESKDQRHIRLQPRNHDYPPMILPAKKINGIWKAVIRYETIT
ncbi:MAG: XRE family transcriptional regulator [Phycisphaerae bacterium]|nr:XRE family transcriptional regulator [Phycisphaerae bacterium]